MGGIFPEELAAMIEVVFFRLSAEMGREEIVKDEVGCQSEVESETTFDLTRTRDPDPVGWQANVM